MKVLHILYYKFNKKYCNYLCNHVIICFIINKLRFLYYLSIIFVKYCYKVEDMILYMLLAFISAKIKGYKLKPIIKSYSLYPYFVVEIAYWFLQINIFMENYDFVKYSPYIKSAHLYALIIPILVYKLYKPGLFASALVVVGTFLNKFVMMQNGGKMPVFPSISKITGYYSESAIMTVDNIHIIGNEGTRFKFLTDFIDIGYSILSIGDLLIHSFTFIVIYFTIKELNKNLVTNNN